MDHLTVRKKTGLYQYRRGVPRPLRLAMGKREVVISLNTPDRSVAIQRYPEAHRKAEALFNAAGATPREDIVYDRTMADLKAAGLVPHDAVRVDAVPDDYKAKQEAYNQAILTDFADPSRSRVDGPYGLGESKAGRLMVAQRFGVERPKHRLSQAKDHYLALRTTKANQSDLPKQCVLVVKALVAIVGVDDPGLDDLTLDVAEAFRQKMTDCGLAPATVRRRITTIKAMLTCYIKDKRLSKEIENNFKGLSVADPEGLLEREKREALTLQEVKACIPYIQEKNIDIQDLWLLQMFTAARPKELSGLVWDDVDLDHATPHIWIRQNELRRLKTKGSKRKVPLVGKALATMIVRKEARVEGERAVFPRYSGPTGSETVSVLQIKAMKQAGIWVKTAKVPYSLRHTTKDWVVRNVGSSWAALLLGHASDGQTGNYGSDDMLDLVAEHLTTALTAWGVWEYPAILPRAA